MVASNTEDNTISVIGLDTLKPAATIRLGNAPEHMEVSPAGNILAIGNIGEGTVSLISLAENRELNRITGLHEPHNMTFSPDGAMLYVGNLGANFVSVIDVAKAKVVNELPVAEGRELAALGGADEHQGIINVTRTPDGRLGFAAFGDGDAMAVFDLRTQKKLATIALGDTPWRAYTTADGRYMIVPNNGDRTVSIISTTSPFKEVARVKGASDMTGVNTGWFETVAFVISRGDDKVVLVDLEGKKTVGEIALPGGSPETGVVTPDGTKLYVALSGSDEVAVIDTRTRKLVKRIKGVGEEPWGAHMVGALNYCH
jgi:YVTN family beta-propeller protein